MATCITKMYIFLFLFCRVCAGSLASALWGEGEPPDQGRWKKGRQGREGIGSYLSTVRSNPASRIHIPWTPGNPNTWIWSNEPQFPLGTRLRGLTQEGKTLYMLYIQGQRMCVLLSPGHHMDQYAWVSKGTHLVSSSHLSAFRSPALEIRCSYWPSLYSVTKGLCCCTKMCSAD